MHMFVGTSVRELNAQLHMCSLRAVPMEETDTVSIT
jgi:hypothetical protein